MLKIRAAAAATSALLTLGFTASAYATGFTSSEITTPADPTLLFQNLDTDPGQTFTVAGTTNGTTGDLIDIDCFSGAADFYTYAGAGNGGIPVNSDGSFSVSVPQATFKAGTCHLLAVPHGTTRAPDAGFSGPRVGFSYFQTYQTSSGGPTYDYLFDDVTTQASAASNGIDNCGPYPYLVDGTSAMNTGDYLFNCAGSFYTSASDRIGPGGDLARSEIQVDGQNAYGSYAASSLFTGSDALPYFPALSASLDSFDSSNGDAQTTEREQLVKCTPEDGYTPTPSTCTAFASTGVALKRVTDYSDQGRVVTVTDVFTSTDQQSHALDLEYETDLGESTAGWEFPGQSAFSYSNGYVGPAAASAPATLYAIDDTASAPSLANPVGAATFSVPYSSVVLDQTIWGAHYPSARFDFRPTVPAGGSTSIGWSYATAAGMAEVAGYAAAAPPRMNAAEDAAQPPAITISGEGSSERSPGTLFGTGSAGSGVRSVIVGGVSATVTDGKWTASVPFTELGKNIVTATLTSNAGNTATAQRTVWYWPPARVRLRSERFNGSTLLVRLACAVTGSWCPGRVRLRYTETVVSNHARHRTTVTIASRRYGLASGQTATVSAGLNATGRRLLERRGSLAVRGTVTITVRGGHTHTAATFRLELTRRGKHRT